MANPDRYRSQLVTSADSTPEIDILETDILGSEPVFEQIEQARTKISEKLKGSAELTQPVDYPRIK